jgi:5-methylthioadenosine/S-adenosylhomocysteine deaminase
VTRRLVLRGGCILTLGVKAPNLPRGDVLIEDGRVVEVGPGLRARDAEVVDASNGVVMPGFVDTHRHVWRTLFRNLDVVGPDGEPSLAPGERGGHVQPEDLYAATLAGLLGAVEAGITTVVDWCDLSPDEDLADAALQAHADAGLRTVFVAAPPAGEAGGRAATRHLLARLAARAGPRTSVALGTELGSGADPARLADRWAVAREIGLRVHAHVGGRTPRASIVSDLATRGLLGEDVTLVHLRELAHADVAAIAASGASVSLAPSAEMARGLGGPPIQQLLDARVRPGLGVEDERAGPGDLFAQMRMTIAWQHAFVFDRKLAGKAGLPRLMTTRDVVRWATVDGAAVAGLRGVTGSLEPGMQADVVVLRTDRPNIFPVNDPIGAVVWGMDTSNLDWVIVGGRVLLREGVLQADAERARDMAREARRRMGAGVDRLAHVAREGER